jgi:hypothetical protein
MLGICGSVIRTLAFGAVQRFGSRDNTWRQAHSEQAAVIAKIGKTYPQAILPVRISKNCERFFYGHIDISRSAPRF